MPPLPGPLSGGIGARLPQVLASVWEEALGRERARDHRGAATAYAAYLTLQLTAGRPFDLHVVDRLARSLEKTGDAANAIQALAGVRNHGRASGDGFAETFMTLRMAQVAVTAGEPASAERFLADVADARGAWGAPLAERDGELLSRAAALTWPGLGAAELEVAQVEASVALGRAWATRGRYAAAERAVRQAMALNGAEVFHVRSELALFLGELLLDRGDFIGVREAESSYAPDPPRELGARWAVLRVQGLLVSGRFGEARARALGALAEAGQVEPRAALHLRWLLAQASVLLNRAAEAGSVIDAAMKRLPSGEKKWAARFAELRELNERRAGAGGTDWEPAKLPEQVLEIGEDVAMNVEDGPAAPERGARPEPRRQRFADEWAARTLRVQRALVADELESASERLSELEALSGGTDSELIRGRTRYFAGLVAYARGDYPGALDALTAARDQALGAGLVMYGWEAQRAMGWAHAKLGNEAEHARHAAEARALLDGILAGLDPEDALYFSTNKWNARDEYVASRALWLEGFRPRRFFVPWLRPWWERQERSRAAGKVLRDLNELVAWKVERGVSGAPKVAGSGDPDDASTAAQVARWIEARQAQEEAQGRRRNPARSPADGWPWRIPARAAVVQLYVLPDRLLAFVVTRREIRCHTFHDVTRIRLRQLTDEALAAIQEQGGPRARALLERLAGLLGLRQVLGDLEPRVDRLVVVPSDVLVNVPFAALPYGDGWLCDRFAVSLLPHANLFTRAHGQGPRPLRSKRFLGVGVRASPGGGLRELPRAVEEVEAAKRALGKGLVLEDGAATPEAIRQALPEADWAHFACHGRVESSDMLRTRLLVGGAGKLTLAELQQLPLQSLQGVVLAACWLSSTLFLPGNELAGLPAALIRGGVRSVVAPLWEVEDEANLRFMERFYERARSQGPVWALRDVQREWAARGESLFRWASYLLYGGA